MLTNHRQRLRWSDTCYRSKTEHTGFWTTIVDGIKEKSRSSSRIQLGSPIPPPEELIYGSRTLRSPTSIVHLEYDPANLAPKRSEEWTRFVCISDTHTQTFEVPEGDVLLHSGDLTHTGKVSEFEKTMKWLYALPHNVKIIIAGNHDLPLHEDWYEINWNHQKQNSSKIKEYLKGRQATSSRVVYLQDEEYQFQVKKGGRTWSVYGSPWSPWFHNWAFNYKPEDGYDLISKFPKTDILLTHGPPAGIFDATRSGNLAGCKDLRTKLQELQPRLHVFGHIHEAHGAHIHPWVPSKEGKYEAPVVQVEGADGDVEEGILEPEAESGANASVGHEDPNAVEAGNEHESVHGRTVFVNAAVVSLQGKGRRGNVTGGRKPYPPMGGPGFQPVVVDLKD